MDKYIGFDIACKKTMATVVRKGKPHKYDRLPTDVNVMRQWLDKQRKSVACLHLTFKISSWSGWLYGGRAGEYRNQTRYQGCGCFDRRLVRSLRRSNKTSSNR